MWHVIGMPLFGYETLLEWSEQAREKTRAALGDKNYEEHVRRGAQFTQQEVVSYAIDKADRPTAARAKVTAADHELTKREYEVAKLVADGMSNPEIAAHLVISPRTADTHVQHILTKLGFTARAQIAGWIVERAGRAS